MELTDMEALEKALKEFLVGKTQKYLTKQELLRIIKRAKKLKDDAYAIEEPDCYLPWEDFI